MRISFSFLLLIGIVAFLIYAFISWQNDGGLFGFSKYREISLVGLLSYANLYNDKRVCTTGHYVEGNDISIVKVSLDEDKFTRSAWVENLTDREIIFRPFVSGTKTVEAKLCGTFNSTRAGYWGNPPVWNHLLSVEEFELLGEIRTIDYNY